MGDFKAKFSSGSNSSFKASFASGNKTAPVVFPATGGTADHTKLLNRDAPNQHPIESITNLNETLSAMPAAALSNTEIQNILGG